MTSVYTMSQLKKDINLTSTFTITHGYPAMQGVPRIVSSHNTVGLYLKSPDGRVSFLDYPTASLCDIHKDTEGVVHLTIYDAMKKYCKPDENYSTGTDEGGAYYYDKKEKGELLLSYIINL